MAKSRKAKMTEDTRGAHRNGERLPSNERQPRPTRPLDEPTDRATEELTRLARIPEEDPDPVFRISAEHMLLYHNPAGEELCHVCDCHLGQRVPTAIGTLVSAALADGTVARHEVAFGSRVYWLTVAPAVADGYVNLYARDITDHKRTENALRQAEQKFRTIFDTTSDGIFLHDLETLRLTMGNQSCLQMLGYTEEEFVQLGIADLHPEADLPFVHAQIKEFLQGGKPIRHEIRFKRKDGSILLADVSPDLVQLNGTRYALVALKDITERKRMEEELRRYSEHLAELVETRTGELEESERRYRSLYHTIADGIFVVGTDGQIEDVNDSACTQLGYTRAELIGMPLSAIATRPDFHLGAIIDRLRAAGSLSYETTHRRKDGAIVPVELSVTLIEYRGRPAVLGVARDITERRQAEETLRQLSRKDEEALQVARMGHWEFDVATGMFTFNDQYYTLHGTTAREAGGYQVTAEEFARRYVHPDDAHLVREHLELARAADDPDFQIQAEARILRADGEARWVTVWFRIEKDAQGRTIKLHGVNQDITERKRAEEMLQASEVGFKNIVNASPLGMHLYELQEDGRLVFVGANPAADEILGVSHAPLVGKTLEEAFPGLLQTEVPARYREAARHGTLWRTEQIDYDEGLIRGAFEVVAFQTEPGKMVAIFNDITERKQAEEALRVSEEHYRSLFDNMLNGFAFCRMFFAGDRPVDFTYLEVNRAFESLTGLKDVTGKKASEVIPGLRAANPELFEICGRVARTGRPEQFETYVEPLGMWFLLSVYSPRQEHFVAVFDVITERKRAEEAQRRLNGELEVQVAQRTEDLRHTVGRLRQLTLELSQAEDRERKRIADILHEDVQQTLAAAKFHLNLLSNEAYDAGDVREIVEQVKHMLKDAIEKSRNLSHELSPAMYQVELLEILSWLARQMREKHGLTVSVEAYGPVDSPSEPLKAFLYKVVQELLFNVVKHAGVSEARIRVRRTGPSLYLSVADQGCGFDPQQLEKAGGFGLLGIRERVQLLGGRMRIRSTPGAGSRVLLTVPYEPTAQVAVPTESTDGFRPPEAPAQGQPADKP